MSVHISALTKLKQTLLDPAFPGKPAAGALTFLALALALYSLVTLPFSAEGFISKSGHAGDPGSFLLYGIRELSVRGATPLDVFFALFRNLEAWLPLILKAALALVYALAYELGRSRGGRLAGVLYLFAAVLAGMSGYAEPAQLFTALFLLLYLNLEAAGGFSAGLALGFAMLLQPSLFLLPLAALGRLYTPGQPARRLVKSALPLIAGAYILMLPGAGLHYFLSDRSAPAAQARSWPGLGAGLAPAGVPPEKTGGPAAGPAGAAAAGKPASAGSFSRLSGYGRAVQGRAWKAALMFPYAFTLALLALVFFRKRAYAPAVRLASYLVLAYCLFPGQENALYPLQYLLGFIIVSGLRLPAGASAPGAGCASPAARLLFAAALLFNLFAASLALAYPFRAGKDKLGSLTDALERHPAAAWLLRGKGEELLRADMTAEGLRLLKLAAEKDGAAVPSAYILRTLETAVPEPPPARYRGYENGILPAVRLLRELDLDRVKEAEDVYYEAYRSWDSQTSVVNGVVYKSDSGILKAAKAANNTLEAMIIRDGLRYWDKARRPELIARLKKAAPGPFKSATSEFLALPLKTPRDLEAFRAYVGKTDLYDYVEPFHYDKTGRKFLEAARRQRRAGGGGKRETPLGLVAAALEEQARKAGASRAAAAGETFFSLEELKLLRDLSLRKGDFSLLRALVRLNPDRPAYLALCAEAAAGKEAAGRTLEIFRENPGLFLSAAVHYSARDRRKEELLLDYINDKADVFTPDQLRWAVQPLQAHGRYGEALAFLNNCISKAPASAELYGERGHLFRFKGDAGSAEKDFIKALDLAPGSLDAELDLAAAYLAQGKTALTAGERGRFTAGLPEKSALEAQRNKTDLLLVAADFFESAGFRGKAAALLDFSLKDPGLSAAQLRRAALTLQHLGRTKEALAFINAALARHPANSELFNDRGVLMELAGDPSSAERDFLKAVALQPNAWQPQLSLFSLLTGQGRRGEAAAIHAGLLRRSDLPAAVRAALLAEPS